MPNNLPEKIFHGRFSNFQEASGSLQPYEDEIWKTNSLASYKQTIHECSKLNQPNTNYREYLLLAAIYKFSSRDIPIKVLDVGGNLGQVAISIFSILGSENIAKWHIIETNKIVDLSLQIEDFPPKIQLFENDSTGTDSQYDLIHFGSILQYLDRWEETLANYLVRYSPNVVVFSDAMVGNVQTFVTLQEYYGKKMPYRFLNLDTFLGFLENHNFVLEAHSRYVHDKTNHYFNSLELLDNESFPSSQNLIFTRKDMC